MSRIYPRGGRVDSSNYMPQVSPKYLEIYVPIHHNPLALRAAKRGLTILEIFNLQTHFLENIKRRNVDHKSNKNSPSNILRIFALFKRYLQKYESSRRHFLEKL